MLLHEPSVEYFKVLRLLEDYLMGNPTVGLRAIKTALDDLEEDELEEMITVMEKCYGETNRQTDRPDYAYLR